jgi:hypothetical protein
MPPYECQIMSVDEMFEGQPWRVPRPLHKRVKLAVARRLPPELKRPLKRYWVRLHQKPASASNGSAAAVILPAQAPAPRLQAGDLVRVRSSEEIQATLDPWKKLKGCRFMPEMAPYCGTTQRVLKPLERFYDECERSIKKANGLVLLEGVMCQGVAESGRCDRSCFFFWREEWLERLAELSNVLAADAQA